MAGFGVWRFGGFGGFGRFGKCPMVKYGVLLEKTSNNIMFLLFEKQHFFGHKLHFVQNSSIIFYVIILLQNLQSDSKYEPKLKAMEIFS